MIREVRQKEFAEIAYNQKNGLLHLTARFGKIKTVFNFLKTTDKVLVIYPRLPIKNSWLEESEKWNFDISNFEFISTASLKKVYLNQYDWVIWDEPQEVQSDKVLTYIAELKKKNNIIGLSGSLGDKTLQKIEAWIGLKEIAVYPQSLAIKEGVVTDYEITVEKLYLDKALIGKYKWVTEALEECKLNREYHKMKSLALTRMRILHSSVNRLDKVKEYINIHSNERIIFFTHLTKFADSLGISVYHSKAKEKVILDSFKEGHIKHLATLDMIGAGISFKKLNKAVICTFTSNPEELYQRINRITAMEMNNPDKKAYVHIFYIAGTQEEVWLKSALSLFEQEKIKYV